MSKGWFTMKDVLKDLEKVTGKKIRNLGTNLAITGEHPPPMIISEEDDDITNMCGEFDCRDGKIEPDLPGITNMLRLVNDHNDDVSCNDDENIDQMYKIANGVVSISKLNPNVQEFVPRSTVHSNHDLRDAEENGDSSNYKYSTTESIGSKKSSFSSLSISGVDFKETCETDTSNGKTNNNEDIDINKKIDISKLNLEEIKCIREKLKLKISDTFQANCLKKKRERNLAIASLLKLHTNRTVAPTESKPLKLMTPDYFQTVPNNTSNTEGGNVIVNERVILNGTELNRDSINMDNNKTLVEFNNVQSKTVDSVSIELSTLPTTSTQENTADNDIADSRSDQEDCDMEKEIRDSVKKVNNWLNKPEKQKHKVSPVFLGPITFKRKETTVVSPSGDLSDTHSSVVTSDSFVPSTYADELTKNYMKRSKAKEAREDIWTKLERELKEKDKAFKEKN